MSAADKGREFFVARRRRGSVGGIFIASGSSIHNRPVIDRCRVPTPEGPCGHPLFEGEPRSRFDAHIVDCLARNRETIMEARARQHPEIMEPWDTELDRWIAKHSEAILEGRKRI